MDKEKAKAKRAEGSVYVGLWLSPSEVEGMKVLKESLGINENAPLFRKLLNDAVGEGPKLEGKKF